MGVPEHANVIVGMPDSVGVIRWVCLRVQV